MPDGPSTSRKLIRWPVVHEMTGKSRTQVWRDIKAGRFPAPVQTGPNSVAWYQDEVQGYVASRPRVRYAPTPHQPAAA
jgi:prophage regulatory protein